MTDYLRPYQLDGAAWLAGREKGILRDEMGLGKTPQAVRACDLVAAKRVVVVCPAIGVVNWQREFAKWSLYGPELRIYSYDKLVRSKVARDEFRKFKPDTVILDEGHYLKSRDSKRTKFMYGQHCHNTGLLIVPKRVWILTGTLMPNNVTEMWTHVRALWPHLLGERPLSLSEFIDEFALWEMTDYKVKVFGNKPAALPRAREILSEISLRRTSRQVLADLPPIIWQPTYLVGADKISEDLQKLEETPYIADLRRVLEAADEKQTRALFVAEEPIEMASVRRLTAELKARPVARLIAEELRNGAYDKIVIFVYHLAALDAMDEELFEFAPCQIRGGQSEKQRQIEIDAFQNDPHARVILVQLAAGYHTITLHAAAQVAFLEQSWTPEINIQAAKRCHRFGQTRPVFVRNFGLAGSIDEAVSQVLSRKAKATLELEQPEC